MMELVINPAVGWDVYCDLVIDLVCVKFRLPEGRSGQGVQYLYCI